MKCPACQATVTKPAEEGGVMLKARYIRIRTDGVIVIACQACGVELEPKAETAKLVLLSSKGASRTPTSAD